MGRYELVSVMARCLPGPLAAAVIPRLFRIGFRFLQPLLISRVTRFVAEPVSELTTDQGWGLVGAYGLVYIGLAVGELMWPCQLLCG